MPSPPPASGSSYQSTASFRTNEEILFPESKLVQKDDMEARIWKSADKRLVMEEVALMKKLDHPGIVKIYEFLETEREYYLVLELCERVLVKQDHKTGVTNDCKDEVECNDLFRQLVLGIEYMHGQGVVHRDIKPENLLLIRDRDTGCPILKISDFGISRVFQQGQDMMIDDRMGTRAFTAPELYRSGIDLMGHKQKHEAKATDIWSMGVTLYVMFHGKLPFHKSNEGPQYDYAHGRKDECKTASAELTDLLNRMLEPNPDKRIKMDEIRAHSWVTNGGLKPLKSKRENVGTQIKISDEEEKNAVRKTDFRKVQDMNRSYSGDQLSARFRDISQGSSSSSPPTRTSFPGFAHDLLEPLSSGEMLLNPVDQVLMIEDRDVVETRPVISSPPTSGRSDHFVTAREAAFEGDDDHLRSDSEDYGICF
ncbi:hypothetical protein BGZ83_007719 [Gryganskiella cystojenkinii]|nr:hypothetical protein BGZ83_007719 [Gryganskiella cystojenkinii]